MTVRSPIKSIIENDDAIIAHCLIPFSRHTTLRTNPIPHYQGSILPWLLLQWLIPEVRELCWIILSVTLLLTLYANRTDSRQLSGNSTDETEVCVLTVYRLGGDWLSTERLRPSWALKRPRLQSSLLPPPSTSTETALPPPLQFTPDQIF